MKSPTQLLVIASLMGAVVPAAQLFAQDDAREAEEIFELSPFVVAADTDAGYYATTSMAGSRLNTQLRDVASSIQVVTAEFMEDVGATNMDTLMQYTTSSETAGSQGNFTGVAFSGESASSGSVRENIGMTQRIRGLGNPDKTRDFYKTIMPFDSYNTSRVDINRGANSFLFGLGSPAGLINANLNKAEFRDRSEIVLRVGEGGEDPSARVSMDFNRVVVDDVLAIRLSALVDDKNFRQRPTYLNDKRIYGAITYKPLKNTTIRAHFEQAKQKANPTDVLMPTENLSMFLDAPDGLARLSIDVVNNVRVYGNSEGPVEFREGDRLRNFNAEPQTFFILWEGLVENSNNAPLYARANGVRGSAARMPTPPPYWNTEGTSRRPFVYYVKHGNFQDYQPGEGIGWFQRGFVNLDTFDFSKYNLSGQNDFVQRDFKNYNISLQQLLWDGKAGFELAFDWQEFESDAYVLFQGGGEHLFFDINETLLFPDPDGDGLTPMPNPNYGRVAIMSQNHSANNISEQESLRFSGFVQHNFSRNTDGFLGKLLGRHRFTTLIDQVSNDDQTIGRRYATFTPDGTPVDYQTTATNTGLYSRQMFQMVYVSPPQLNAFTDPNFSLADFQISPITTSIPKQERTLPTQFWNVQTNQWDQTEVTGRWVPSRGQRLSKQTVTSYAFNTQSHLLDDLIVVNLGWRRDEVRQKLRVNDAQPDPDIINIDPSVWNLDNTPELRVNEEIFGYGAVLNLPRKLLRLPDWFDMSIHYNESENFVPAAGFRDYLGNSLPPPGGKSKDYGFTLFLFDSKLVARVNWFEAALANANDGGYSNFVNSIVVNMVNAYGNFNRDIIQMDADGDRIIDEGVGELENRSNELLARAYEARDWMAANLDPAVLEVFRFEQFADGTYGSEWGGSNTIDLYDNQTEGIEFEIVANPLPNWRISISASKYETVLADIAPRLTNFINNVSIPFIQQYGDLDFLSPTRIIGNRTVSQDLNQTLFPFFAVKETEGTPSPEQREWSFNFVTNYSFRRGPLKGFSIGGAYRWQDSYAYGYPTKELNGIIIPDVNNPYMSDTTYNVDVWFGYRRKIFNDKVNWILQLNIRNINNWNSDNVSVIQVQPDGSPARARFDPPREIFLTSTFRF